MSELRDSDGSDNSTYDADHAARAGEQSPLEEELKPHVPAGGPQGAPQADLGGSLPHGDQHHREDAEYAAMSTLTAIMGRMAAYSVNVVTRDQALHSPLSLSPDRYTWAATPPTLPDKTGAYPVAMPGVTKAW